MCRTIRVGNLDAAILRSARVGCVLCNRLVIAKAFSCKAVAGDPMLCEPGDDGFGASFRERLLVGICLSRVKHAFQNLLTPDSKFNNFQVMAMNFAQKRKRFAHQAASASEKHSKIKKFTSTFVQKCPE